MRTYEQSLKSCRDNYSVPETAERRALEEGRLQGKQEGKLEEKLNITREMKRERDPVEKIARITGLSLEEIAKH